jgi:hypothetical protein
MDVNGIEKKTNNFKLISTKQKIVILNFWFGNDGSGYFCDINL